MVGRDNVGMLEDIPMLRDSEFTSRFPGIENVAGFIASAADGTESQGVRYPLFRDLEIRDINDYINLLNRNDELAIKKYKAIKGLLGF